MCTVVIRVPAEQGHPIRLLAVRDEDPGRPWDPLGSWWPDLPGAVGVRDRRAGGAWLAARDGRLAVLLNREGAPDPAPNGLASRGAIVLDAVAGRCPTSAPRTLGFNLLEIADGSATLVSWDGRGVSRSRLEPGTHMIAHDDLDDARTPRIARWLHEFSAASTDADRDAWWLPWLEVLTRSAQLPPTDDRAIIRDNRAYGLPTLSLLVCIASISPGAVDLRNAVLPTPGIWDSSAFSAGIA